MTPELTALALTSLRQAVQYALFATPANIELRPGPLHPGDRSPSCQSTVDLAGHPDNRRSGQPQMTRRQPRSRGARPCN